MTAFRVIRSLRWAALASFAVAFPGAGLVSAQSAAEAVIVQRGFDLPAGVRAVPMDIETIVLDISVDAANRVTAGRAVIQFQSPEAGRPYFLLSGDVRTAVLNGQVVPVERVPIPDGDSVVVVTGNVPAATPQQLEIDYLMSGDAITYREGGVGLVTAMADIDDGNFFEDYGPSSYEDDQLSLTLNLSLAGVSKPHQVFTNGALTENSTTSWSVQYPPYFTTSSFYFHVTDAAFAVRRITYPGLEKEIPVTVYSATADAADQAIARLPGLFAELESDYGPYLHDSFTAFISGAGGMEHGGATITSIAALGHELTHSWFGRGVMPSGGSAGWIDEAVATWRDRDYPRSGTAASLSPANIGALSPFERFTPFEAYDQGGDLLTVLDNLFASAQGLKPILRDFFAEWKTRLVTTQDFQSFVQARTEVDLTPIFDRSVLGRQAPGTVGTTPPAQPGQAGVAPPGTLHPPSLTPEEVEEIR